MKPYMITGALSAALLALSACGNPSDVEFTENGEMIEGSAEENAAIDVPNYGDPAVPGYETASVDTQTNPEASIRSADAAAAQAFVDKASQRSLTNVRTSEVALERATTPEVKEYAQMVIDQHTTASDELRTAMAGAMLTPPSMVLDADHQSRLDDITVEEQGSAPDPDAIGNAWDHDYIAMQIDLQSDTIDLYEDYAANGGNDQLRAYAEATVPTLKAQLEKAREIEGLVDDNNIVTPD